MGAADASIFSRQMVKLGDFSVPYLRGGRGAPLVYLHGLGGGGRWESYHMALANDTLTHALSLPGWGDSTVPEGITCVADYAALVVSFVDALEIEKVILVGHSFGGWIAQYVAVEHPERVSRLLLVDSLGAETPEAPASDLGSIDEETFAKALLARLGLIASAQPYGFGAEFTNASTSPEFERQWKGAAFVGRLVGGPCQDPALAERLAGIQAETLLVWGESDGLAPVAHARRLHDSIPNSRLAIVQGAGHLPMVEKREAFHRLCRDFLVGVDEQIAGVLLPARSGA